ncbi:MAG: enolase C-terminal domain-like protein [Rhodoglobus sp.]
MPDIGQLPANENGNATRQRIAPAYAPTATDAAVPWNNAGDPVITAVEVFVTAPEGVNLVIVRVHTSIDGLEGLGCATFHQRANAVRTAIEEYVAPRVIGRSVHEITDIWNSNHVDGYWRGGPVLNSALAGLDIALWDIKGKLAGLPVWQLLGGRVRRSAQSYVHASGRDIHELVDQVEACVAAGYEVVRAQITVPGTSTYGAALHNDTDSSWDPEKYVRLMPRVFEELVGRFDGRVRFLHDIHERVDPVDATRLLRALEPYGLFFVEDPVAPEDLEWMRAIRQSTIAPLALGELLTDMRSFTTLVTERLVDFVRCHVTALGGITPAWRLAVLAEIHGVKTAWHGPRDVSPVGHMASLAMDLASPAFGIHEHFEFSSPVHDVFPGTPVTHLGALDALTAPGLGIQFDERQAAKHPPVPSATNWHYSRVRRADGTIQRP